MTQQSALVFAQHTATVTNHVYVNPAPVENVRHYKCTLVYGIRTRRSYNYMLLSRPTRDRMRSLAKLHGTYPLFHTEHPSCVYGTMPDKAMVFMETITLGTVGSTKHQ